MKFEANNRQHLTVLNLVLTALILLGVIVMSGWILMLDRQVKELSGAAGELAIQLTLQTTLEAYQEEVEIAVPQEEEETIIENTDEAPVPEATTAGTPTPTPNELTEAYFSEIEMIPNPMLDELSELRHFRLPPLEFRFPEGWNFRFTTDGQLTLTDSFGHETTMQILASNDRKQFILNEIGVFELLQTGRLSWYPDTTPIQGLGAGDYQLYYTIDDYTSEPFTITVEDAPMARILESVAMYRTHEDIAQDNRYLSFASQQEPMSMYGYMVMEDGTIYIRVWRAHDKYYYWVNGNYVMHPDLGILYNDVEDLMDAEGEEIIPRIEFSDD